MRVFLGNPPWSKTGRLGVRAGSRWPFTQPVHSNDKIPPYVPFPFYLAYSASLLLREGIEVVLIDAVAEGMEEHLFLKKLEDFKPDLVLFETSTPSIDADLELASKVTEITGAHLTLAGPHVTVFAESILKENAWLDSVLLGEYEQTLLEVCRNWTHDSLSKALPGMMLRKHDGNLESGGRREPLKEIDSLPWPAREFLPILNYRDDFAGMPAPNLQMWASRGCPYGCIFCLWPAVMYNSKGYRVRNPANVAEEMAHCIETYNMKSVFFDDDTFNIGKPRLLQLSEEIIKRGIDVPWAIMARADLAEKETLEALKKAGLYAAKYGVESGNQAMVDRAGKGLDLKRAEDGIRLTQALGIKVHLTFTFGLPGETWDTVRETIDFAVKMNPETLQFSINTPFPGTKYYESAQEAGFLEATCWSDFDGAKSAVLRTESMTASELESALEQAYETWERVVMWRRIHSAPLSYIVKGLSHPRKAWQVLKCRLQGEVKRKIKHENNASDT